MANTVIQLKYSTVTDTPSSLNVAEPAYSYSSNTLFIGSPTGDGSIAIGGKFYLDQQGQIFVKTNSAFTAANSAGVYANSAFAAANSGASAASAALYANGAFVAANSAGVYANSAYGKANTALNFTYGFGVTGTPNASLGGTININNTGVQTISGLTTNQVIVSQATGNVVISLPQNIQPGANPTFVGSNFSGIPNAGLTNSSVTVTAGTGMSGGGAVSLGGTITLTNFSPFDINDPLGQFTLTANPKSKIINSFKNKIVTIDEFDPNAIIVNVTAK